jgi:hypothetical protein
MKDNLRSITFHTVDGAKVVAVLERDAVETLLYQMGAAPNDLHQVRGPFDNDTKQQWVRPCHVARVEVSVPWHGLSGAKPADAGDVACTNPSLQ